MNCKNCGQPIIPSDRTDSGWRPWVHDVTGRQIASCESARIFREEGPSAAAVYSLEKAMYGAGGVSRVWAEPEEVAV